MTDDGAGAPPPPPPPPIITITPDQFADAVRQAAATVIASQAASQSAITPAVQSVLLDPHEKASLSEGRLKSYTATERILVASLEGASTLANPAIAQADKIAAVQEQLNVGELLHIFPSGRRRRRRRPRARALPVAPPKNKLPIEAEPIEVFGDPTLRLVIPPAPRPSSPSTSMQDSSRAPFVPPPHRGRVISPHLRLCAAALSRAG